MPRVAQPGGLSRKMRVRYTVRRKLSLLASAERIMEEEGVSLRKAAFLLVIFVSVFSPAWMNGKVRQSAYHRKGLFNADQFSTSN